MDAGRPSVLALVLAGGAGGRMGALTERRAKPALPFAGVYRLIDFPLSNCVNSGISDVWVLQQYAPHSLADHLANGRPWDLDRSYGGLKILHPQQGTADSGWYQGNADALYRNRELIAERSPDVLVVLSADHVYRLDYARVVAAHLEREADVTVVSTEVDEDPSRFGVVAVDGDGRVTGFEYKPEEPSGNLIATEVFVYTTARLLELVHELARDGDEEDSGLGDFGEVLLPRLVADGRAFEYRLEGYWRDVGTIESYWEAHMDLVAAEPPLQLGDERWPIRTFAPQYPPARVAAGASVEDSLVSPGCSVSGRVVRSVLAPGCVVEEGAEVAESVLLHDSRVSAGASVSRAIVDATVTVAAGASVGRDDGVAVIGRR